MRSLQAIPRFRGDLVLPNGGDLLGGQLPRRSPAPRASPRGRRRRRTRRPRRGGPRGAPGGALHIQVRPSASVQDGLPERHFLPWFHSCLHRLSALGMLGLVDGTAVFQRSRIRSKNQEQEQAGSGAEASTGSQELLKSLLSGASV